jgi:hypothetical protein
LTETTHDKVRAINMEIDALILQRNANLATRRLLQKENLETCAEIRRLRNKRRKIILEAVK